MGNRREGKSEKRGKEKRWWRGCMRQEENLAKMGEDRKRDSLATSNGEAGSVQKGERRAEERSCNVGKKRAKE